MHGKRSTWLLLVAFLPLCWLLMMVTHEAGHVAAAWISGGVVSDVVLHPLVLSRTDLSHNPRPLLVAWGGPLLGVAFPLLLHAVMAAARLPGRHLTRFFAGFCLIANGAYLGAGSAGHIGDAGDLQRHGSRVKMEDDL